MPCCSAEVDAAFFVISAESDLVDRLLRHPDIALADFSRADAYTRRYRFLNSLELPEGVVDLAANIPDKSLRLLAPTANLVADPELHPAVIDLLLQAATEVHRSGGWFEGQDEFPMPGLLAFPLSKDAERFYKHGPPFLQRYLPFWAASLVDRLKVMLLPLLVLLLPLLKVMPPIYTWRMRAVSTAGTTNSSRPSSAWPRVSVMWPGYTRSWPGSRPRCSRSRCPCLSPTSSTTCVSISIWYGGSLSTTADDPPGQISRRPSEARSVRTGSRPVRPRSPTRLP